MGLADQRTEQRVPFSADLVFSTLVKVLPALGYKLKSSDKIFGRITARSGLSLFSWGENVTLVVERVDDTGCLLKLESALLQASVLGMQRNQKNFDTILGGLSRALQEVTNSQATV